MMALALSLRSFILQRKDISVKLKFKSDQHFRNIKRIMELTCSVQKYEWGNKGDTSTVALLANLNSNEQIDKNKSYAEFWMGDHTSGPSRIKATNELLSDYIKNNPASLGDSVIKSFGPQLPYLFKVLSVGKALSVQVHPSKQQAEVFFFQYPDIYKDPNHKPELAIALTHFEAMCSFRPVEDILALIQRYSEINDLIGEESVSLLREGQIKPSFQSLMSASTEKVSLAIGKLIDRKCQSAEIQLIKRLNAQYPNDVGVLCVFWLNYVILAPGEALYLGPNEPHAYIFGDCVECMANSDNVIRAGLTPKFRDISTLCKMLTYKSFLPNEIKFQPVEEDGNTTVYIPPVQDFAVARIKVKRSEIYTIKQLPSASIILTMSGLATAQVSTGEVHVKAGSVLFVSANEVVTFSAHNELDLYRAFCNV